MNFVENILNGKLDEAKSIIFERLNNIVNNKLEEIKKVVAEETFVNFEEEELDEANRNIQKMGRLQRVKRRIRRDKKGKIVVQRNIKRSGLKGFRKVGNTVKRIPASVRIAKARKLRRSWKTTRRAKLKRTLMKRRLSNRRRSGLGI